MATPHVTGAVALYKASRPLATPAEVKAALRAAGTQDWSTSTDPDGVHEPLLDVARIVALGDWTVDSTSPPRARARGATLQVPVYVVRAEDVTADVALSVDAPTGFGATLSAPVVGPDAKTAAITVAVPSTATTGTYTLRVHGTVGNVTRTVNVAIRVDGDPPSMRAPRLAPVRGSVFNTSSYTAAVVWSAATDPTGPIARYQAQVRPGAGAWGTLSTVGASTRSVSRTIAVGTAYAIRVRATDAAGNTGAWAGLSPLTSAVVQDRSGTLTRSGSWHSSTDSRWSGGSTAYTRSRGAWVKYAFKGRGIGVVMPYGPGRGKAQIWIDGSLAGTVDMSRSVLAARRIAFSRSWASSGTHSVRVVALGTSGRPRVDVDAFVVVR